MSVKHDDLGLQFGHEVRRLRKARGLSQSQLAAMIPTDTSYISKVEHGHRTPSHDSAGAWDSALGAEGRLAAMLVMRAMHQPAQLPVAIPSFVGRNAELAHLDQFLARPAPSIILVDGPPGIGKTMLALRWAHRVSRRFPDGQLYIDLRGYSENGPPVTPKDALGEFLIALGVPAEALPEGLTQRAALYRTMLSKRAVLIVLDNAAESPQIESLLPGSASSLVVVTSRRRLSKIAITTGARRITLSSLSAAESAALITGIIGGERTQGQAGAVDALAARCGYLPLAMRIAAEQIVNHPYTSVGTFVDELASSGDFIRALDVGESLAVRTVFSWSFKGVDCNAMRLWRLLSMHPGAQVSVESAAAMGGLHPSIARQLMDHLAEVHLLEPSRDDKFTFHRLLREYATERTLAVDSKVERRTAVHRLLTYYLHKSRHASTAFAPNRPGPIEMNPAVVGATPSRFLDSTAALAWFDTERENFPLLIRCAADHGYPVLGWQLAVTLKNYLELRWHPFLCIDVRQLVLNCAKPANVPTGES
ncbi:helix-turn-helix domain-containing protein [Nonomuraea typhae]|uniref:helix-turn-helix domain-containing protein n=1 Tax=Nonomuraea typhae TaxID=2603600 RepID=UPI0012FCADF6|nr:helix-turn-helix domain-containing protein [Nonomuraea typhae]